MSDHNSEFETAFEGTRYLDALKSNEFGGPLQPAGELVGFAITHIIGHTWEDSDEPEKIMGEPSSELTILAFAQDVASTMGISVDQVLQQTQAHLNSVDPEIAKEVGDYWTEAA